MASKRLLSDNEELVLKKALPSAPKGRILKKKHGGGFFIIASDDEYISGEIKTYDFTNDEINRNPQWFGEKN